MILGCFVVEPTSYSQSRKRPTKRGHVAIAGSLGPVWHKARCVVVYLMFASCIDTIGSSWAEQRTDNSSVVGSSPTLEQPAKLLRVSVLSKKLGERLLG